MGTVVVGVVGRLDFIGDRQHCIEHLRHPAGVLEVRTPHLRGKIFRSSSKRTNATGVGKVNSAPSPISRASRAPPSPALLGDHIFCSTFHQIVGQGKHIPYAQEGQAGVRAVLPGHGPSEPFGRHVRAARRGLHADSDARGKSACRAWCASTAIWVRLF